MCIQNLSFWNVILYSCGNQDVYKRQGTTLPFEVMHVAMPKIISIFPMTQGIQLMKVTFLGLPTENVLLSVVVMGAVILICFGISVKCFKWE